MTIQPLSRVKPHADLHLLPPRVMTARPEIAALIAESIAEWAQIECGLGVILAVILETEAQTGLAMLTSLTSSNNQMAVVTAAANAKLTKADQELFGALMILVRSAAKDRHKLAHWCWMHSEELPDALLMIDQADQAKILANMLGYHDPLAQVDRSRIYVLRKSDAEAIATNIKRVSTMLTRVVSVFWQQDRGKRAELRRQLSSEPPMAEALRQLQSHRKNTPEPPPPPHPSERTEEWSKAVREIQRARKGRTRPR